MSDPHIAQGVDNARAIVMVPQRPPPPVWQREPGCDDDDTRPCIQIGPNVSEMVQRAIGSLSGAPNVFVKDKVLMVVTESCDTSPDAPVPAGAPITHLLDAVTIREQLSECSRWFKKARDGQSQSEVSPPVDICASVARRGWWPGIRQLSGLSTTPFMRPDGSICQEQGYDYATRVYFSTRSKFPQIKENPTQEDARQALREVLRPFREFPFDFDPQEARDSQAAIVAAMLSIVARPAICGPVPAFVSNANVQGSGKSFLCQAIAIIATGADASTQAFPPDDEPELQKTLAGLALASAPVAFFDNVKCTLGGPSIEGLITSRNAYSFRMLGTNSVPRIPWRTVILASGNNSTYTSDMARRTIVMRIGSNHENPERLPHSFDVLAECRAESPRLVAALLTILRAYVVAGRPKLSQDFGSFGEWADLIPGAIVYAGGGNVMNARPTSLSDDPEKAAYGALLVQWEKFAPFGKTVKEAIEDLYPTDYLRGQMSPSDKMRDAAVREAIEGLVPTKQGRAPDTTRFGYVMRKFRGRVVGGRRFEAEDSRTGTNVWKVSKVEPKG